MGKTRKKVAQDYSRNAIADSKSKSASVKKLLLFQKLFPKNFFQIAFNTKGILTRMFGLTSSYG